MDAVNIQNINHVFPPPRKSGVARTALKDVVFSVQEGEIFGLLGPNGGGKSTLFRILSTLLLPTAGSADIFGASVTLEPHDTRRKIGVVFQNPSLDKKLTLLENLLHQGHLFGMMGTALMARAQEVLQRLGLQDRCSDLVETLSGGLQRRGEIAKGLLHKPQLLLMDEPSTGLDPGARRDLWDYMEILKNEGMTILVTTHLMEEGDKCDRLAILHHGRIVALGSPHELRNKIGGDVISIETPEPAELTQKIQTRFGLNPVSIDGTVRLEIREGHKFIPQLVEAFPGSISAVTVGKPTLEDVFIKETGRTFWMEEDK